MAKEIFRSCTYNVTDFSNTGKQVTLALFVEDMRNAVWDFVEYLWTNRIEWTDTKGNIKVFDIQKHKLELPLFMSTKGMFTDSPLSQRALSRASSQAIAIVKSAIKKRQKQLHKLAELMKSDLDHTKYRKLQRKIDKNPLIKPSKQKKQFDINLNSNCARFDAMCSDASPFSGYLIIKSIGKKYGEIRIPIKSHRQANQLNKRGFEPTTTWLLTSTEVRSVWVKEKPICTGTEIVGADQGKTTTLSLSDSQVTKPNKHGKDLNTILAKLARKKKGSIGFRKAQEERTNYINWAINQLNFSHIKELRLEKLKDVRKGKNTSSTLKHWTYTDINTKIYSICEELGVQVTEQNSAYRSQRCNRCGWVQKSNRQSKGFICKSCGFTHDADINGALNHEAELSPLQFGLWRMKLNLKGFYWTSEGIFDNCGSEIIVPNTKK